MRRAKRVNPLQGYVDNYRDMLAKLHTLSGVSVRQFLGSRRGAQDPRVQYLQSVEAFKNLANAQLGALQRLVTEKLGLSREDYLEIFCQELEQQLKVMQDDLCVTGWDPDGRPTFNLEKYRQRTGTWPV